MAKIIIVDENDNYIEKCERKDVTPEKIFRASSLWIENTKNQILLAQRSMTRSSDPGKWGPAVAGTLEDDEVYESNIYKEAEEELGIKNVKFKIGPKFLVKNKWQFINQMYTVVLDWPLEKFKINEEEVSSLKWANKQDLISDIKINPISYTPLLLKSVENLYLHEV